MLDRLGQHAGQGRFKPIKNVLPGVATVPIEKFLINGKQARIQVLRDEVNEPHVVKLESFEAIC